MDKTEREINEALSELSAASSPYSTSGWYDAAFERVRKAIATLRVERDEAIAERDALKAEFEDAIDQAWADSADQIME